MKTPRSTILRALLACGLVLLAASSSAATLRFNAQPVGSKVRLDGTSNIHDWAMEGALIGGYMELEVEGAIDTSGQTVPNFAALKGPPKVSVVIPVRTIQSVKGEKKMDEIMLETMKENQFRRIEYQLKEWSIKELPKAPGEPAVFNTKGELTVAGVKKTIEMPVTLALVEKNKLKASGQTTVKMTDFGLKPPSPPIPFLGSLIKTGDDVKVTFEWLTALRTESK